MDTAVARARLEAMREDLDRSIAILRGEAPERDNSAADAGSGLTDHHRVEAALESLQRHRGGVAAALDRIGAGTYGRCVGCGHPVPEGRLEARPDAARCIPCQTKHDRR
ncbi:TraR/DksA family transcriptional regulator [Actinomadura madurae]|uniref:TraR/DksA family transcriptional regulator n=1 Tax=Actinomadura madurae TaxID=1993 RepID=UPI002026CD67|nr:TraR/DksA C4-type zinc finger protein [Actinomadura madurae]MCP9954052.1 TraR/DksA family transcriptional regulator [Actinomadura madurae]MCP9983274.1 TraR/DksA family transcriptional regulator [Actinomadura madurae]MCQ0005168.1 TraR/DksA family transcriptional regulator [Actinomadura madurae]MCQ0019521.1 TraR/DksA family transcriptional regulator [Actinomadura madurae]URM99536.1 TraR/DksA family transcriptional regulator [Actinomadura madurae]